MTQNKNTSEEKDGSELTRIGTIASQSLLASSDNAPIMEAFLRKYTGLTIL